jgi:hypothetical protein
MRVHLVDGTYELFRAHYSHRPPHESPEGKDLKATRGVVAMLGSVAGCSATLTPSRAQATAGWEELEPLRVGGRGAWPEDAFFRQRD